jgi:hypothetical protein
MGVRRTCKKATCRKQFTPARGTRREYCYDCRPEKTSPGQVPAGPSAATEAGPIEAAARAELERVDRLQTVAGQVAVRLARDLDSAALTGSQASSVSAQLLRTMEAATVGAPAEPDEIDAFQAQLRVIRDSA